MADSRLFWRRVGAYLLDIILLFAALAPVGFLVQRALGFTPATGPQIWVTLLLNFSVPTWTYFALFEASQGGATTGKRWLGVKVVRTDGGRIGAGQTFARTAMKLLPWELVHFSAFGLAEPLGELGTLQLTGLVIANGMSIGYLICAAVTRGRRSVHDLVAGTAVSTV